ncbi:tRNA (adenosine(37)-N6)-threonylcarbamoyltransferase complex dimerization subunit type 1 TsaB [Pseudalkalibacillus berkeleyi]|uniref:tRNA (Adenosine(37)-N6)-threonylcarbamoyltransferase complex dimerization subunit type 1 TsaB n=1 Tax=Pseudalkalibacillus berkeleyi TaxID=1069813 RepID=A0ABS9H6I5_9BACL|nr:tRNA (adenosine(37)-N6)-threonylcarbamoyltransferase complex dimerization subunit type 1 TsaB [Pseudalkalibacillus berkeleyi]MCF6139521.1 tRNA (adenosine(37)-N6)-threonylcarbamoyltransferase complex dimerization subunit type 1 TsaB [Pseudalkalibacillus berkeleyi]
MKALAIDTSNLVMGVSVIVDDRIVGELTTNMKKNHSVRLMPAIENLLQEVDVKPNELDKIIVAKGPGSYTGVRIGVSVAKTMAWSLNIPVTGVSSLEVVARNGKYFDGLVCPLFDGRRGQIYTGLYGNIDGVFQMVQEERIIQLTDWIDILKEDAKRVLFLGNDLPLHQEKIVELMGDKAIFGQIADHNPRSSELAALGVSRENEDPHAFTPSYLQLAEAEAKWIANQKK